MQNRLRNLREKRDMVVRERSLLTERIDTLVGSIGTEVEARKRLRKEINEMNEAFRQEIKEMAAEKRAAEELEECYFSDDEELVENKHKKNKDESNLEEGGSLDSGEEDLEDNVDEIVKEAEEEAEDVDDPGVVLFDNYPESPPQESEDGGQEEELESKRESLTKRVERHNDNIQMMRKSNFLMKAKIDRLYDILQEQKEKHRDLRLELTRMLADIQ